MSTMSSSSEQPQQQNLERSMTEVFSYSNAAVAMLNYKRDQSSVRWMSIGMFSVNVVTQTQENNAITITVCSLDGLHWPLAKDIPIIRMGKRTFVICFPGLVYALQFPPTCRPTTIQYLEKFFMKFVHYYDFADNNPQHGYPLPDNDPSLWRALRSEIQPMAHDILLSYQHPSGLSRFCVSNHNSCFLRAARFSAATNTLVDAITSGILLPEHITIQENAYYSSSHNPNPVPASASISVLTSLVDSLEASLLVSKGLGSHVDKALPPLQTYPNLAFKVWRLNESGLATFLKDLESSAAEVAQFIKAKTNIPFVFPEVDEDEDKGEQVAQA